MGGSKTTKTHILDSFIRVKITILELNNSMKDERW